jgi:hypothetical protein
VRVRRFLSPLVVIAAVAAFLAAPTPAAAAGARLTIQAVPALRGLDFSVDGHRYTSDARGRVSIPTTPGVHVLKALPWRHRDWGTRVSFSRWGDDSFTPGRKIDVSGNTRTEVGYSVSYRIRQTFVDLQNRPVDGHRVSTVTLASSLGERYRLRADEAAWLEGTRVARRLNGLEKTLIRYSLMDARVEGSNVVNQAQQRFYIAKTPTLRIRLSLYSAHFSTHDLLFRTSIGSGILLTLPNGKVEEHPLDGNGEVTLRSLPRGEYGVKVKTGAGISMAVPVALSRNQEVPLKVISYVDLAVGFIAFAAVSIILVLGRRPHLRRKLVRVVTPTSLARRLRLERQES